MTITPSLDHTRATYLSLRRGLMVISMVFPFFLWWGGSLVMGVPWQSSLSAYYYTDLRDVFVGTLWAIGAFLYLYKGCGKENLYLNIAGISAVLLASLPMDEGNTTTTHGVLHYVFAGIFFVAISVSAMFPPSIDQQLPQMSRVDHAWYQDVQKRCAYGMLLCLIVAVVYYLLTNAAEREAYAHYKIVFWIETVAIELFGIYWLLKTNEIDHAISWVPSPVRRLMGRATDGP